MTLARSLFVLVAFVVWAGSSAGSARSALFFLFQPTSAAAGDLVTVRTVGTPLGFAAEDREGPLQQPIRLYLVRNEVAGTIRSRFDRRLHFVGRLVPDARGRAALTFAALPLDTGAYAVAAWCPGCAKYSRGSRFSVLRVDRQIVPRFRRAMLLSLRTTATTYGVSRHPPEWR